MGRKDSVLPPKLPCHGARPLNGMIRDTVPRISPHAPEADRPKSHLRLAPTAVSLFAQHLDCFPSSQIKQIKYSIYNTSGYNQSDTEDFIPNKTTSITDNETYYSFTLNKNLPTEGRYYIEIQFLDENGDIVDTASVEHIYIAN